jgi:hypothetical protein
LSKLTSLTHLSIRPCSDTVFGPSRLRTLSRLVDLRLPMVVFAAPVFAELLEELPLLRRLSVSISVLLLRRVESDEPAIECYPDATAFPPDLAWLTFNSGTNVPPSAPARQTTTTTTTRTLVTRRQATATTPAPTVSAFQSDPLTASTLERLAELLSASSPRLGVLKFKGDYPPGTHTTRHHTTPPHHRRRASHCAFGLRYAVAAEGKPADAVAKPPHPATRV